MATWLAPFAVLAAVLAIYFLRKYTQAGMRRDVNFYMVGILATAAAAIISSWRYGQDWTDYLAWGVAVLAIAASVWRAMTSGETVKVSDADRAGPLGRS